MATPQTAIAQPSSFLPNFCHLRAVLTVVVVGQLLAIMLSLSHMPSSNALLLQTLGLFTFFIQWLGISSAAILCISRRIFSFQASLVGLISYLILLLNTLLFAELAYQAILYTNLLHVQYGNFDHQRFLLHTLGIAAIIYALLLRYLYMHHQWQQQLKSEAEARFQVLQTRIRPHFLFNTLNTIACLIHDEPVKAEHAIEDFSELLRTTLQDQPNVISLSQEFTLCKHYLDIEKLRLGDRLIVEWDLQTCDTVLPPLLIQPLVENAVYHGIESTVQGGTLKITSRKQGNKVIITLTNPCPSHASNRCGHQLAQNNIRQRLALAFGDKALLNCEQNGRDYQVTLSLPITKELQCAS